MWQMMLGKVYGAYSNYGTARLQNHLNQNQTTRNVETAELEANAIRRNAKARYASAGRQAREIQYQARGAESDAISAMAAGGTVTDPVMLAKLKLRYDRNSIEAVMQGQREYRGLLDEASAHVYNAKSGKIYSDLTSKINYYGAKSTFAHDLIGIGNRAYRAYRAAPSANKYGGTQSNDMYRGYQGVPGGR